jgi:hypothetical protein
MVQFFFAWRIKLLTQNITITGIVMVCSGVQLCESLTLWAYLQSLIMIIDSLGPWHCNRLFNCHAVRRVPEVPGCCHSLARLLGPCGRHHRRVPHLALGKRMLVLK